MYGFFHVPFYAGRWSVVPINSSQSLQTALSSARLGAYATLDTTVLSVFEVYMFFHSIAAIETAINRRVLKCFCFNKKGILVCYVMLMILKSSTALAEAANFAPLENLATYKYIFSAREACMVPSKLLQ